MALYASLCLQPIDRGDEPNPTVMQTADNVLEISVRNIPINNSTRAIACRIVDVSGPDGQKHSDNYPENEPHKRLAP
jgi:hypothetical protein